MEDEILVASQRLAAAGMVAGGVAVLLALAFLVFTIVVARGRRGGLVIAAAALQVATAIVFPALHLLTYFTNEALGTQAMFEAQLWIRIVGMATNITFWVLLMVGLYRMLGPRRAAGAEGAS